MLHQMQINLTVMNHYFDAESNLSDLSDFLFSFLCHFSSFAASPISAFYFLSCFLSFFSVCLVLHITLCSSCEE